MRKISIILPIYNEDKNLKILFEELFEILSRKSYTYEIIAVNDGSVDESLACLKNIHQHNRNIKIIDLGCNYGQTAAIAAGVSYATGDIIVPIDSDCENDPQDIPLLLEKLDEGYDVVSGWRKERWNNHFLTRKCPSIIANWIISKIVGIKLHDYGCTLKAYKREMIDAKELYGEMHRFIPLYAWWKGARVAEIPVHFRLRKYGKSHYGIKRTITVVLDLIVIMFFNKYMSKPMHFFGGLGFASLFTGILIVVVAVCLKLMGLKNMIQTPLPVLSAIFIIVGVQLTVFGILGELLMRTYYETQNKRFYHIKEKIGI